MQKISTPVVVVAAALINADGSVLMRCRPAKTVHEGLWEFPGGKVEAGESPEDALVREISEEIGVVVEPGHLEPVAFASGAGSGDPATRPLVILLYSCRLWKGLPQSLEGGQVNWFAIEQLPALDMPPLDYPLARRLVTWVAEPSLGKESG